MSELYKLGVKAAAQGLAAKEFSSVELTQAVIGRVREKDGEIGAYLTFDEEGALAAARVADEARANVPPQFAEKFFRSNAAGLLGLCGGAARAEKK